MYLVGAITPPASSKNVE